MAKLSINEQKFDSVHTCIFRYVFYVICCINVSYIIVFYRLYYLNYHVVLLPSTSKVEITVRLRNVIEFGSSPYSPKRNFKSTSTQAQSQRKCAPRARELLRNS